MQYMSQAFFFYIKTGAGSLQKMGERCGRVQFDLSKKLAENFLQKKRKKSKYLLTDRNIGVSMYPY